MHVSGHKCHIAYLVLWNSKQLQDFNEEEKQNSVIIPVNTVISLSSWIWKKKETKQIWCLSSQDQPTSFLGQEEQVNRTFATSTAPII